jgi:RNA polymerase sigma-32 factor
MLQQLLSDARTRPLPANEQLRLMRAYHRTKDPAIERMLVETNLRLVAKLARQLDRTHGRSFEDLLQEGCLGLVEAIRRFDPERGAALSTYAGFWIRAYIGKFQMDNVRIVRSVRTRAERVAFFKGVVCPPEVSLDAPVSPDRTPLVEFMPDPGPEPDARVEAAELTYKARKAAKTLAGRLSRRDLTILNSRVLSDEPTPMQAVAQRMALSRERVRQIELGLMTAIRHELEMPTSRAA